MANIAIRRCYLKTSKPSSSLHSCTSASVSSSLVYFSCARFAVGQRTPFNLYDSAAHRSQYLYEAPLEEPRVREIQALLSDSQRIWKAEEVSSSTDEPMKSCTLCLDDFRDGETVLKLPW